MTKNSMAPTGHKVSLESMVDVVRQLSVVKFALTLMLLMAVAGCASPKYQFNELSEQTTNRSEPVLLREGDILRILFPSAPNLNASQQIRRDGKITLQLVGEVDAAGLTAAQLEKALIEKYRSQLTSPEVTVAVESSSFSAFVTGAVIKPGKITSSRPITALEAIMEAGGFDYVKANLKAVKVIRNEGGKVNNFTLDLKRVIDGKETQPFYLKPSDIVYVPERFVIF